MSNSRRRRVGAKDLQSQQPRHGKGDASGNARARRSPIALAILAMYGSAGALPMTTAEAQEEPVAELSDVEIIGNFRSSELESLKYARPLLDTPRVITVLSSDLLEEQNVVSLRDAMRNVSGISLQAGEGNPPGGDQLKIRGFNARDDLNVNGVRDLGNYFRDPFYVDQIEVVKGPNSTFAGRGSAGGTVNFVTKQPQREAFIQSELSFGSDNRVRATVDVNQPIDDDSALRLNLMTHSSDIAGRDVAEDGRYGLYGAYKWNAGSGTTLSADYLHTRQDNIPDVGLPFDRETRNDRGAATGRIPDGIDFEAFFGHRDDHQRIEVDQLGFSVEQRITPDVSVRNRTRISRVFNDTLSSSPRIRTQQPRDAANPGQGSLVDASGIGDIKPRFQTDEGIFNQTDLLVFAETGGIRHDVVVGVEVARFTFENRRRPDVGGGAQPVDLFNPDSQNRTRPQVPFDGSVHKFATDEVGVYLLDSVELTPSWLLDAGVRYDRVTARASERGHELGLDGSPTRDNVDPLERTDDEVSFNLGLVYKPTTNSSLYASVGNAFQISGGFDRGVVQLAGGGRREGDQPGQARPGDRAVATPETFDVAPEETVAFELGGKWRVLTDLELNAAVFRTEKTNARTPGIEVDTVEVLDGEQRVQGFELIAAGRVSPLWRAYASYTYQDSEVTDSNVPFEIGQRLGGTPEHSFNFFTLYDVTPRLTLGAGMQAVSDQVSNIQSQSRADAIAAEDRLTVAVPGYAVFDAYASYRVSERVRLRVNAFNVGDREYISQVAEGGSQGIPGLGRQFVASVRFDF